MRKVVDRSGAAMRRRMLLALVVSVAPAAALAQATVPESALQGPVFAMPNSARPNQNVTGSSGIEPGPALNGPHVAPGTPGALIPKLPMSAARATDPALQAYIRGLQQQLPAHGYRPGPVTGRLDPATEQAILAYQHDAGLQQNARSTWVLKQTLDSVSFAEPPIRAAAAATAPAAGRDGSVVFVQQQLAAKGYDPGPADGRLGRRTVTAIKDFQNDRGLTADGRVSQRLLDLLGRT